MSNASSAEEFKALGNEAFAAQDYDKAISYYTDAIKADSSNHVFFSNRSASYGGKGDWAAAAQDAKECIRLDPTFIKGYYRLATAQAELEDWDGATSTIKQGLLTTGDANNAQLLKQLRMVKAAKQKSQHAANKKRAAAAASSYNAPPPMDASVSRELQDLHQQYVQTKREHQIAMANLTKTQREYQSNEITKRELEKIQASQHSKLYRGIGKMFLQSTRDEIMQHLNDTLKQDQKKESDLKLKLEYLERRLKSQQQNMEELTKSTTSASAVRTN